MRLMNNDPFVHESAEQYRAARQFVATARKLAGYLADGYDDLSARLGQASTELALKTGATADPSLADEVRAEHCGAARSEARNCSILLDIVSAINLGYASEHIAVARKHLLQVVNHLPPTRKSGSRAS